MAEWLTYSEADLQTCIGDLRELHRAGKLRKVKSVDGKRSLNQNDISHVWYEQMAREDRQEDALGWKSYCKLHHGIPILRAEDAEFRAFYDAALKSLSYEQKREAMKYLPVTSLMTKPQLSRYLGAVQADFAGRHIYLQFPEAA
jgi:hypothetical protein